MRRLRLLGAVYLFCLTVGFLAWLLLGPPRSGVQDAVSGRVASPECFECKRFYSYFKYALTSEPRLQLHLQLELELHLHFHLSRRVFSFSSSALIIIYLTCALVGIDDIQRERISKFLTFICC